MPSVTFNASTTWTFPAAYVPGSLVAQATGEGASGLTGHGGNPHNGGPGGGAGEWAQDTPDGTPGVTVLTITIGTGNTNTDTTITGATNSVTVTAHHGSQGSGTTGGLGGTGSTNAQHNDGGKGGNTASTTNTLTIEGGGGGGAAGSSAGTGAAGGAGGAGSAGSGGTGVSGAGSGGNGSSSTGSAGSAGTAPGGGGGGGAGANAGSSGPGAGKPGQVILTWLEATPASDTGRPVPPGKISPQILAAPEFYPSQIQPIICQGSFSLSPLTFSGQATVQGPLQQSAPPPVPPGRISPQNLQAPEYYPSQLQPVICTGSFALSPLTFSGQAAYGNPPENINASPPPSPPGMQSPMALARPDFTPSQIPPIVCSGNFQLPPLNFGGQIPPVIFYFPQTVMASKVEVLLNGTWTDITNFVYQRANITIQRGRPNESTSIQPSAMTLTLNNRDGRFSPKNQAGAFFPFLTRNTQIRCSLNPTSKTGQVYSGYRYWGEVSVWPPSWDVTGNDVYCQITANGVIRRLQQSSSIGSALYRYYTRLSGDLIPIAYWSCQDATGSTSFASGIPGVAPGTWTGTPSLSSNNVFGGSDALPELNGSVWTFNTGQTGTAPGAGSPVYTTPGVYTFIIPNNVTAITNVFAVGGGGGAGDLSGHNGQDGGISSVSVGSTTITAHGGKGSLGASGNYTNGGLGGTGSTAPLHHDGGAGAAGFLNSGTGNNDGGGGGASGGSSSAGNPGSGITGGLAVTGGGPGGNGSGESGSLQVGSSPASGPGGGGGGDGPGPDFLIASGGGGGGEWAGSNSISVTAGQTVTITVGAAGSGGGGDAANGYAGAAGFSWAVSGTASTVNAIYTRLLLEIPASGGVDGAVLAVLNSASSISTVQLVYHTGGHLELIGKNSGGTTVFDSGSIAAGVDGIPLLISIEMIPSGSNVNWAFYSIPPGIGQTPTTLGSGTVTSAGLAVATSVVVNNGGTDTGQTTVGHIAVQYFAESLATVAAAAGGYAGELAAVRFARLCDEQGIAHSLVGQISDTGQMGPQQDAKLVDLLQAIEDFDRGQMFEPRDFFGLTYRTKASMINQSSVQYDYQKQQISPPIQPVADDQLVRNDVTLTRFLGSSARAFLATGTMSIQDPPNGVGEYSYSATIVAFSDSQLPALAQWIVTLGTVDDYRYPQITIDLSRPENADSFVATADMDIGDFFTIINQPDWIPDNTIKQLDWGYQEEINNYTWRFVINAVPEQPYEQIQPEAPRSQLPLDPPGFISPAAIGRFRRIN